MAYDVIDAVFLRNPGCGVAASVVDDQPFDAVETGNGPRQIIQRDRERLGFVIARNLDDQFRQWLVLELGT